MNELTLLQECYSSLTYVIQRGDKSSHFILAHSDFLARLPHIFQTNTINAQCEKREFYFSILSTLSLLPCSLYLSLSLLYHHPHKRENFVATAVYSRNEMEKICDLKFQLFFSSFLARSLTLFFAHNMPWRYVFCAKEGHKERWRQCGMKERMNEKIFLRFVCRLFFAKSEREEGK